MELNQKQMSAYSTLESHLRRCHPNITVDKLARDRSAGHLIIITPCYCDHPPPHAAPGQCHYHRISVVGLKHGIDKPFKFWAELQGVLPDAKDVLEEDI